MFTGIEHYGTFLVSAFLFAVTPGLDTVFVLNKALCTGRRSALISSVGINAGILVHTVIGALGLSAILAASAEAFMVVKFAGAAYLVWLGLRTLFSKTGSLGLGMQLAQDESAWTSFRTGLVTNVLNPKVALFVLAFFPQFISHESAASPVPFLILGVSYAAVGLLWYLPMAFVAGAAGKVLREKPSVSKWLSKASGVVFMLLGLKIAMAEN